MNQVKRIIDFQLDSKNLLLEEIIIYNRGFQLLHIVCNKNEMKLFFIVEKILPHEKLRAQSLLVHLIEFLTRDEYKIPPEEKQNCRKLLETSGQICSNKWKKTGLLNLKSQTIKKF